MAPLNSCQVCFPTEELQASWNEPSFNARRTKHKQKSLVWCFASWNVRSLVDVEGSIETARKSGEMENAEDRKVDQVVRELGRYEIVVVALQETKWFGEGVYRVGDSIVLAAGRQVPGEGQVRKRGKVWPLC